MMLCEWRGLQSDREVTIDTYHASRACFVSGQAQQGFSFFLSSATGAEVFVVESFVIIMTSGQKVLM